MYEKNPLLIKNINKKIEATESFCHQLLIGTSLKQVVPNIPARDITQLPPKLHPAKSGLSSESGLARLLHDLATIELQAMELGIRTLIEFPNTEKIFQEQLVKIILEEKKHLELCLEGILSLGFDWGSWPTHTVLWQATSEDDSLLDRLLIVHNFLEGSGLDASDKIQARLFHCNHKLTLNAIKTIASEEIEHVRFGTYWYIEQCKNLKLDPDLDFDQRLLKLYKKLPRRLEKLNTKARINAGFTDSNISSLKKLQQLQRTL